MPTEVYEYITIDEAITELKALNKLAEGPSPDIEMLHSEADLILARFVHSLGYSQIADLWNHIPKWYA